MRLRGSWFDLHSNSGTDRIIDGGYCTGTRKQRSYEIGTSKREYVEPDTQGIGVGFVKEGTTGQPDSAMLGIGRPIAAPSQIPPPTPIDRLHPVQPEIARPCIGRPITSKVPASSSDKPLLTPETPLVGLWYNNYNSDPLDICIREWRWYTFAK